MLRLHFMKYNCSHQFRYLNLPRRINNMYLIKYILSKISKYQNTSVNPTREDPFIAGIKAGLGPVRPRALKSKYMNIKSYKCYTILCILLTMR